MRKRLVFLACLASALVGCAKTDGSNPGPALIVPDSQNGPLVDQPTLPSGKANRCVQVFFDRSNDPTYGAGRDYATMTLNLLGHFPEFQRIVSPIELYRSGDLDRCVANIYIGSYYDNVVPSEFLSDFETTSMRVAWLGFNVWQLGEKFDRSFGYHVDGLTFADFSTPDEKGDPGYFRDVHYRGETFKKWGEWDDRHTLFQGALTQTQLSVVDGKKSVVLASARHSVSKTNIPWAIRSSNRFYVAEAPFDYINEGDRYLVFADLLFDILQATPRHADHPAVVRLEDLHAFVDLDSFELAMDILNRHGVPAHLSVIPIYSDPFAQNPYVETSGHVSMNSETDFIDALRRHSAAGASVIWHGVTHQVDQFMNPFSGVSGDDYEFWDQTTNAPLTFDSSSFVLDRLESGKDEFRTAGLEAKIWISPHYKASPLASIIFSKTFAWTMGRQWYIGFKASNVNSPANSGSLLYSSNDPLGRDLRWRTFKDMTVENDNRHGIGQFFPYEIIGDVYGQNVLPENLGNVQPDKNAQVGRIRTKNDILSDAKRNLVLRDSWGSFFFHPFLLDDANDLEPLVVGLQNLGYRFVNLNEEISNLPTPVVSPIYDLEKDR